MWQAREDIVAMIEVHQTTILVGETGTGKTTQVAQFISEAGNSATRKLIACTQPRQVAAMGVARRVADEMDVMVGEEVGYSVRCEDCTGLSTLIKCVDTTLSPMDDMRDFRLLGNCRTNKRTCGGHLGQTSIKYLCGLLYLCALLMEPVGIPVTISFLGRCSHLLSQISSRNCVKKN